MNNREKYIKDINKIEIGEEMKKKTLEKMKNEGKWHTPKEEKNNGEWHISEESKRRGVWYTPKRLISIAAVFILMLTVAVPIAIDRSGRNANDPMKIIAKTGELPKVENFDNLYAMLEESGSNYYNYGMVIEESALSMDSEAPKSVSRELSSSVTKTADSDYSKTNAQVEGVDEADIVKTDGEYIYYISNRKIVVVDAKNPEDMKIAGSVEYETKTNETFSPREIYINGSKLIVIGTKSVYENDVMSTDTVYRSYYPNSKTYAVCKTYSVSNKSDIRLEREVELEGSYLTSRMIGEDVYFITNKNIYMAAYYRMEADQIKQEDFKPEYKDTTVSEEMKCVEFEDISYFPDNIDQIYLNIAGFNINNNKPANIKTYLGAGNEVYVSDQNLYVTNTKYEYKESQLREAMGMDSYRYEITTHIYKFKLENGKVEYSAVGEVSGAVLNQFSMDEYNGYFRIATTNNSGWTSRNSVNNVYILNENLEVVGKTENLAKGEKIYSARFMGNKAYIVTFVETDPLFVIDLSNPKKPTVLGELKIPGYSKYLHPYDENHLIGFGEETEVVNYGYGNVVRTTGIKMALFDVTDPSNPKEMHNVKIGDKGTYSELLYNHKALLFSKEKDIMAFPITVSKEASSYRSNLSFQGAMVYGVDLEKGFTLKGTIAHMQINNGYTDYDYNKAVERIIYIKDNLYTMSRGLIKASDINTMEEKGKLELETSKTPEYILY